MPEQLSGLNRADRLSSRALRHIQLRRLRQTIDLAQTKSLFYRRSWTKSGIGHHAIKRLADLNKLPCTSSQDLIAASQDFWIPPGAAIFCSGGTIGRPRYFLFSADDLVSMAERSGRALLTVGVSPPDYVVIADSFGMRSIGHDFLLAIQKIGAVAVPTGRMDLHLMLEVLRCSPIRYLVSSPSYVARLLQFILDQDIEPQDVIPLKGILLNGEPLEPKQVHFIETAWKTRVYSLYGAGEVGTIGIECNAHDGVHIYEDHFWIEVINPVTLESVSVGEPGELVLTTLTRKAMPLIRYRTSDLVQEVPGQCRCGRHLRRFKVKGRLDGGITLQSGNKVYPFQVSALLKPYPEVIDYQLIVTESDGRDLLTLKLFMPSEATEDSVHAIENEVAHLSIDFSLEYRKSCEVLVERCDIRDMQASVSGKMTRFIDKRH